jgi:hypothetical protein
LLFKYRIKKFAKWKTFFAKWQNFIKKSGIVVLNMSAIAGFLKNANANTNDLVGEFQEAVLARLAKGVNSGAVLFALMAKLGNEPADNSVFNWWERDPVQREIFANGAVANTTGTTIVFDDGAGNSVASLLNKGDVLCNSRTNEYVQLTADSTNSSGIVARGIGGTTAANINDNDVFVIVTRAQAEGSLAPRGQYIQPSLSTNYVQEFAQSLFLTRQFKGQVTRIDPNGPIRELRIQALERLGNDIELAYFFGRPGVRVDADGSNVYTTGGLRAVVDAYGATENVLNGNGATGVQLDNLNSWLYSVLREGSDAKVLFCGPRVFSAFSLWANTNNGGYRTEGTNRVFGMAVTEIQTPYGPIGLVAHPLFKQIGAYNSTGVLVDLAHVTQKVLEPVHIEENIQTPGQSAYGEKLQGMLGLKAKYPNAHGYCYGLQKIIPNA